MRWEWRAALSTSDRMIPISWRPVAALLAAGAALGQPGTPAPLLDLGYHQMYDLQFDAAHKTFGERERLRPEDPLAPVSNAAAYLFAEFDRLRILQSEFFVNDGNFRGRRKLTPDPGARAAFDAEQIGRASCRETV